jgi:flagellar hook-associated protein 1 FlgK
MASLSSALTVALSGLQASTVAAQVAAGNISNAQTPGYTEKNVNFAEISNGSSAGGVQITGYGQLSDSVLTATLNGATSNASYLSTQSGYMTQVQSMLDSSNDPPAFASAVSNFQSAWTQFAAAPESATQQQAVISAGQQLVSTISGISTQALALQTQVQGDLSTTVTTLNTDLTQVQTLNNQISAAQASNQPIGDLVDQRTQAVNAIAAITSVQIMPRANGQIALYTPSGTMLVDGSPQTFSVVGNNVVNSIGANVDSVLTGGKLQAQTDFLSTSPSNANGVGVVTKLTSQLQNFANMFVNTASGGFASAYNGATTNTGELASGFFTATLDGNGLPDLSTLAVNSSLVSGASTVKQAAGTAVSNTFTATNLAINTTTSPATTSSTFSATGLTTNNQNYASIATAILSGMQQAANTIKTSSTTASTQQTYYQNSLSSETGVNTDTELVNLTNWQNAYAASAHVISTINAMFTTLENMV